MYYSERRSNGLQGAAAKVDLVAALDAIRAEEHIASLVSEGHTQGSGRRRAGVSRLDQGGADERGGAQIASLFSE